MSPSARRRRAAKRRRKGRNREERRREAVISTSNIEVTATDPDAVITGISAWIPSSIPPRHAMSRHGERGYHATFTAKIIDECDDPIWFSTCSRPDPFGDIGRALDVQAAAEQARIDAIHAIDNGMLRAHTTHEAMEMPVDVGYVQEFGTPNPSRTPVRSFLAFSRDNLAAIREEIERMRLTPLVPQIVAPREPGSARPPTTYPHPERSFGVIPRRRR